MKKSFVEYFPTEEETKETEEMLVKLGFVRGENNEWAYALLPELKLDLTMGLKLDKLAVYIFWAGVANGKQKVKEEFRKFINS